MKRKHEKIPKISVTPEPKDNTSSPAPLHDRGPRTIRIEAQETQEDSQPDALSSQYEILEKIADGGMGIVYLGRDSKLGRYVAIKRLNRASLARSSLKKRFFREAKAIAALNHIHIVHLYALSEDRQGPYIVMEYVPGRANSSPSKTPHSPFTLADRVHHDGPLAPNEALDLVIKLSAAIEYAHGCGVIHRDLKPSNVLLDESGEPKIVDFGLARKIGAEDNHLTVPGEKMLSLGYGAPEQESDASMTDERADVYGLGALLYFSITGKNPRYFRENDVPEAMRMPIVKALETDRNKRWSSAKKFAEALMLIKAPSTVTLPTTKTTWRCKWCDTINPVAVQFCGRCGWDGGDLCPECGSETRTGIQYCGNCGANAREYETATLLLERLKQHMDTKAFDLVAQEAEQVSSFKPTGSNGQQIVKAIYSVREQADKAMKQASELKQLIKRELEAGNYEHVREHVNEYNTLAADKAFDEDMKNLRNLMLRRDLERARKAIEARDWYYAARICHEITDHVAPDSGEARRLLEKIKRRNRRIRFRNAAIIGVAILILYVLSAAPVRQLRKLPRSVYRSIYSPVRLLHRTPFIQEHLHRYSRLWTAADMYEPRRDQPPVDAAPSDTIDKADELASLTADYAASLEQIEADNLHKTEAWADEYLAALRDLQYMMRQAGDFEGRSAVWDETLRFESEREIPGEALIKTPSELRSLQAEYQGMLSRYSSEKSVRILSLARKHVQDLTASRKKYTNEGRTGVASLINAEIKRIQSSSEVTSAETTAGRRETGQPTQDPAQMKGETGHETPQERKPGPGH